MEVTDTGIKMTDNPSAKNATPSVWDILGFEIPSFGEALKINPSQGVIASAFLRSRDNIYQKSRRAAPCSCQKWQ
jgi:hypothetical protein